VAFKLNIPAFRGGGEIPVRHTCDGENLSPHVGWDDPPRGTQSLVLIADDPDAPSGLFTHWIVYDIPSSRTEMTEGQQMGLAGAAARNDFGHTGYGGPCPPPGHGPHRYFFTLSALDVASLGLSGDAGRADVDRAMQNHVIGTAQVMGRYERRKT
jgi:Raf kinase inhibitor-like YbhB/YbcL family protein